MNQTGRRVLGEESGSLHLSLTLAGINMGVEPPGLIGLHPLEQQSLLWGSHVNLIGSVSKVTGLSSAGGGYILDPMSLASVRFLKEGDNGPTEVLPLGRGEILRDWWSFKISWLSLWFILSYRVQWMQCLMSWQWFH